MAWPALLDFFFPPQCASCNALGSGFCDACAPECEPIRVHLPTLRVAAYGLYEGTLRSAILALKDGRRDVAEALGRAVARFVPQGSVVVPIPTTAKRLGSPRTAGSNAPRSSRRSPSSCSTTFARPGRPCATAPPPFAQPAGWSRMPWSSP
ncbi:MAG TPA: hypothetical protein VN909_08040 [Candidatus Dormibacteraeota bacterium]|nr:hypothetical protein [Candidatus Dormibacteraeota bacterium]